MKDESEDCFSFSALSLQLSAFLAARLGPGVEGGPPDGARSQQHRDWRCAASAADPLVWLWAVAGREARASGRRGGGPLARGTGVGGPLPTVPVLRRATPDCSA